MNTNTQGYQLNEFDYRRIKPLQEHIKVQGLEFKYFITLDYFKRTEDLTTVLLDNRHLKKTIRSFFKSDIRMLFFTEKHLKDPTSKFYGSYHRHILMEDIPAEVWKNPTKRMERFMLELSPEMWFACKWNNVSEKNKMDLLKKVVKGFNHQSIPNGRKGTRYDKVFNLDGLLSYCTKQNRNNIPNEYVIDLMNSDGLDNEWYRKNYGRHQTILTWAH